MWRDAALRVDLAQNGAYADVLHSECECFSRRTISGDQQRGCNLNFTDEMRLEHGGGIRSAELHYPGSAPILTPPARYDPADPDRVMLVREIERGTTGSDWIALTITIVIPVLGLLAWLATGRVALRKSARDPRLVAVEIDPLERGPGGVLDVCYLRPGGAGRPCFRRIKKSRPACGHAAAARPSRPAPRARSARTGRPSDPARRHGVRARPWR